MNEEQINAYLVTDRTLSQAQVRAVVDGVKLGRIDSPVCLTNRTAWRSLVIRMARIIIRNREQIAELRHECNEALARNHELTRKLGEATASQIELRKIKDPTDSEILAREVRQRYELAEDLSRVEGWLEEEKAKVVELQRKLDISQRQHADAQDSCVRAVRRESALREDLAEIERAVKQALARKP